ncbi:MAG: D-glycero-alpha-D-manno-heptose-1,7-bisphosphate 7-phosphatase [Kiritimatiellia bacterium]
MRCIFFDRDGIVNTSPGPGYVESLEDFHIQPAFMQAAAIARDLGYAIAIATNQRGVALGSMSKQALDAIHAQLLAHLHEAGIPLLGIYCCTHERNTCTCRKPQPGLLLQAAKEHDIDLSASWMIGDNETDIEAGRRAGCRTILVHPEPKADTRATHIIPAITDLPATLTKLLAPE